MVQIIGIGKINQKRIFFLKITQKQKTKPKTDLNEKEYNTDDKI